MPPVELLTTAEVAELLDVTPRRVLQLAKDPGFPEPFAVTRGVRRARGMRLWHPDAIAKWSAEADRRPGPRRKQ